MITDKQVELAISTFYSTAYVDETRMRAALTAALAVAPRELPTNAAVRDAMAAALNEHVDFSNLPRHVRVCCYDAAADVTHTLLSQHAPAQGVAWTREMAQQFLATWWEGLSPLDRSVVEVYEAGLKVFGPACPAPAAPKMVEEWRLLNADKREGQLRAELEQRKAANLKLAESITDLTQKLSAAQEQSKEDFEGVARLLKAQLADSESRYADALFQAEDMHRQVKGLEAERASARRQLVDCQACLKGADGDVAMLQQAVDAYKKDNVDAAMATVKQLAHTLHAEFEAKFDPILTKEWRERAEKAESERDALQQRHAMLVEACRWTTEYGESHVELLDQEGWAHLGQEICGLKAVLSAEPKQAEPVTAVEDKAAFARIRDRQARKMGKTESEQWEYAGPLDHLRPNGRHAMKPVQPAQPSPVSLAECGPFGPPRLFQPKREEQHAREADAAEAIRELDAMGKLWRAMEPYDAELKDLQAHVDRIEQALRLAYSKCWSDGTVLCHSVLAVLDAKDPSP